MSDHLRKNQSEFTRQAEAFAASPVLSAPQLTERLAEALGDSVCPRLLDVACGPGVLAPVLGTRTRHLVGLDLTAETLRVARERGAVGRASWVRGLAGAAPFAAGSFDAAVVRLALHHFEAPGEVLAEARGETPRRYAEWANIINDRARMDALETVLRTLTRAGVDAGIQLRDEEGELWFTYRWLLVTARAR